MEKMSANPQWTTPMKQALTHGRLVGVDSSMWLYRKVPLQPVVDAKDSAKLEEASRPLMMLSEQLGNMAQSAGKRRRLNKGTYRDVHVLLLNIPFEFRPRDGMENAEELIASYGNQIVLSRLLVVGVRLKPLMRREDKSAFAAAIESVSDTFINGGTPLEDYKIDYELVDKVMRQCGLVELGDDEFGRSELDLARAWWNFGRTPDIPFLVHPDHLHVCRTLSSASTAKRLDQDHCDDWQIKDMYSLTMASVSNFDLPWLDDTNPRSLWSVDLLSNGARAISIRGSIEPPKVTRAELERGRDRFIKDRQDRVAQGRMSKSDQDKQIQILSDVESAYAVSGGTPTWTNLSVVVALDGIKHDPSRVLSDSVVELGALPGAQQSAWTEMLLCSSVRASPQRYDLPAQVVAAAGLSNLSTVGDANGALLGMTEFDRQPAYISPTAATTGDAAPALMVAGSTGSGKTMLLLNMARQWAKLRTQRGEMTPIVFVDPKPSSDFSEPILALGGHVSSLDSLESADGIYDPIRVIINRTSRKAFEQSSGEAVELASSMISSINPWKQGEKQGFETPLLKALRYGVDQGATCVGEALRIAERDRIISPEVTHPVYDIVQASTMARSILGFQPTNTALRASEGLTLVMVGNARISLPDQGEGAWERSTITQRIGSWVLRMMVYGSAAAVANREGVIILDEAWQFVAGPDGAQEIQRLMRLARSQQILVVLATQRISDFVDANLVGGISRGVILPLERGTGVVDKNGNKDEGQAGLALDLFQLERTEARLTRMAARAKREGSTEPNWNSMRALRDANDQSKVVRGTIGLYVDLTGRVVPTEIVIPPDFLRQITTTSTDVIAREKARSAREAAQ